MYSKCIPYIPRHLTNRPAIYAFGSILLIIIIYTIANINASPDSSSNSIFYVFRNPYSTSTTDKCKWVFDHYSPSSWELFWYNNITTLQDIVCPTLTQSFHYNNSVATLDYIISAQKTLANQSFSSERYDELLSKMYYRYQCSGSSRSNQPIVSQYIEPLIGLLRDPLTICSHSYLPPALKTEGETAVQSKRFFLLGPSASYQNYYKPQPSIVPWLRRANAKAILFDLGASYFNGMNAEAVDNAEQGTRWFYEYFRSKSLEFDRIVAFEYNQYTPVSYWQQIPDDIIGKLTFINTGISSKGKFNPWNILKSIAKPEDYVIIKLDIDTPDLELNLINQVLNDTTISSLIDDMFFEMHVNVAEMNGRWGNPPGELKDSYIAFRKLRELGIRMHSWP